ncbi:uncharacterized protein EI90DRAFT_2903838 [Cantharellus anzutake]|uniref:uncharacterized protein n=1 Tax=Cantharellus anzutake TaxID=1750568 RepID=UPI001903B8CF|nr:uncharacterized protein EI90DRAFT_2903838 [Cantharellus anzutake]KAF8342206.1 hypothetical protein EI90DRAFT_2903838 [Cantharellus anzutake]
MEHRSALRKVVKDCSQRGLYVASKWASELLLSYHTSLHSDTSLGRRFSLDTSSPVSDAYEEPPITEEEEDLFMIARAHYDAKEHERVDFLLRNCKHPRARFLGLYCRFLVKVKPDIRNIDAHPPSPVNDDLNDILEQLEGVIDPFLIFLKGVILKGLIRKAEALECAVLSLRAYPWNWSCWTLLREVVDDYDVVAPAYLFQIDRLRPLLPKHPMTKLFILSVMIDGHAMSPDLEEELDEMLQLFPESLYLKTLRARYAYSLRDYEAAVKLFGEVRELDPFRTDDVDTYSNILYTMKKQAELSQLAQHFIGVNKDRPEVSLAIGNYYSLRNEHEKAVKYYHRAVNLDPTYGAAWTLMGHEYLEMKNSHAAIEAYRRGVDINKKDYRAWHGLGQAYELLDMPQYSLHYFQRSTALRWPYDIRMWKALAKTYHSLERYAEAIECYKRALIGANKDDTSSYHALAQLYEQIGEANEAAAYHRRCVDIGQRAGKPIHTFSKDAIELARYEMLKGWFEGDMILAKEYLEMIATSNCAEVKEAEDLLRVWKKFVVE